MRAVDRVFVRRAKKQHRVITWPQLRELGLDGAGVKRRVADGVLYRIHHGVYLLDPPESASRITLLAAAVAACGTDSLLSHHAAAELWELLPPQTGGIDVTVLGRNPGNKRPRIRVHRAPTLHPGDIRIRHGLRVTAPARVALELARHLDTGDLEQLLARARVEQSVTEAHVIAIIHRYPAYPGAGVLRAVLRRAGGPSFTRAKSERLMLRLVRDASLPPPETNFRTGHSEIDFRWPQARLAVEVDGYEFHSDRAAFERDRRRDAAMVAQGWRVMRFTWRQMVEEPFAVVARIAQVLATGGAP